MLDFNHILSNMTAGVNSLNVQEFRRSSISGGNARNPQWQTWIKPRGVTMVFILGVGGGSAGVDGLAVSAGQAGGGSGAQASVLIPAMMIPDQLYVYVGQGGPTGLGGYPTIVSLEPFFGNQTTNIEQPAVVAKGQEILLKANGASVIATNIATTTGGTVSTIGNMCLAGRGAYTLVAGSNGGAAGAAAAAPTTGCISSGGGGGGGSNNVGAGSIGGGVTSANTATLPSQYYQPNILGLAGATGATPAEAPKAYGVQAMNFWYYGGMGGPGGGGASSTAGGTSGKGGPGGFPGGGGGGGTGTTTNNPTPAVGGPGGDGFCYIYSW